MPFPGMTMLLSVKSSARCFTSTAEYMGPVPLVVEMSPRAVVIRPREPTSVGWVCRAASCRPSWCRGGHIPARGIGGGEDRAALPRTRRALQGRWWGRASLPMSGLSPESRALVEALAMGRPYSACAASATSCSSSSAELDSHAPMPCSTAALLSGCSHSRCSSATATGAAWRRDLAASGSAMALAMWMSGLITPDLAMLT
mmetsp:Transcript_8115/g.15414  ORF Transcript_8115/g.15414 Transcript_8115/m.15414 type:complete len:201 (-) Transcript_8115:135-737(-)